MKEYLVAYAVTAAVFILIESVWLANAIKRFYTPRIGVLLLSKPNLGVAALFFLLYAAGIVIFAVAPALRNGTALEAFGYGALFGFFTYATYDMTNYATLRNWSLAVSLLDIAWGTCLCGTSAMLGYYGTKLFI